MLSRYVVSQVKLNSYFLVGVALGLWLALALVPLEEEPVSCAASALGGEAGGAETAREEFEPRREERPLGPAGQAGRAVQRPRYYSTELGMRAALLAGVLSSEEMLETRATALNKTAAGLQPALRFFITASSLQVKPGRANVVGFTDTREMLKPFHALKYLADNYLEEYNFFFLVSDMSYVNARRLNELVSKLSVSQDVYMGAVAEDDTHYCTLEGGILLSNSVLRALHGELDWCVRNSYSAHHHENIGRCVLHAAHLPCAARLQGEEYVSVRVPAADGALPLAPRLADAVTAGPLPAPRHFHQLHAYVARERLARGAASLAAQRAAAAASRRRHPRAARHALWPPALRADAGLPPPAPPSRFDHPRWTRFNGTHAFLPDDLRAVAELAGATARAVRMVVEESLAWARVRWGVTEARLLEGAWCWEPPYALRYRLLVRLGGAGAGRAGGVRQLEAARPLGAARLAPARYVTETGRVTLVVGVAPTAAHRAAALAFLRRYEAACLERDANTALSLVLLGGAGAGGAAELREAARALGERHRGARVDVLEDEAGGEGGEGAPPAPAPPSDPEWRLWAASRALEVAAPRLAKDTLMLLLPADAEFSEDFLNRVRMNTISGEQWYLASGFHRYAHYSHPRFVDADGARPQLGTGSFPRAPGAPAALAAYRADYAAARDAWRAAGGAPGAPPAAVLAAAPLRCLRAPEPALLLPPPPPPCPAPAAAANATLACLQRERDAGFSRLNLGARHTLAKLLLHEQALPA